MPRQRRTRARRRRSGPYIVRLEAGTEFAAWVLAGWGGQRGIFAHVAEDVDMAVLRRYFGKLNMVYGPGDSALLFRYYDRA